MSWLLAAAVVVSCCGRGGDAFVLPATVRRATRTAVRVQIAPDNRQSKPDPSNRQAQEDQLKAMGYRFDPAKKAWVRGDNTRRNAECRSGTRTLAVVDNQGNPAAMPSHVSAALKRLEERIRSARQQRLDQRVDAGGLRLSWGFVDAVTKPWAPVAFLGAQAALAGWLVGSGAVHVAPTAPEDVMPMLTLAAFSLPAMVRARRARDAAHPGFEDNAGLLERCLADHWAGSLAIPGVNEWRAEQPDWRRKMLLLESAASLNTVLFWQGAVQPMVTEAVRQAFMDPTQASFGLALESEYEIMAVLVGAVATAFAMALVDEVPGLLQQLWSGALPPEVDSMVAELQAAEQAKRTAAAWSAMEAQSTSTMAQSVEERRAANAHAAQSRLALERLAERWADKFELGVTGGVDRLRGMTMAKTLTLCTLTAASFGALLGPFVAMLAGPLDRALFPDADASRAVIKLEELDAPPTPDDGSRRG